MIGHVIETLVPTLLVAVGAVAGLILRRLSQRLGEILHNVNQSQAGIADLRGDVQAIVKRLDSMNGSIAKALNQNQAQDIEIASIKAYLLGQAGKRLDASLQEE